MSIQVEVKESIAGALMSGSKAVDGVVRGVKILGQKSKNKNRRYPREVMEAARSRYEGKPVNINHTENASSSFEGRFGVMRNVRMEGEDLRADLHYNPKHILAEQFAWAVENQPSSIGFSHVAKLREKRVAGGLIVEAIELVKSVDLVADPATTSGVFEDVQGDGGEGEGDSSDDQGDEFKVTGRSRALTTLNDSDFAFIEAGGKRDGGGRTTPRAKRLFPLDNADAVRTALNTIPKSSRLSPADRETALNRARRAAARLKISVSAKEGEDVDYSKLTKEEIQAERPDLFDGIVKEAQQGATSDATIAGLRADLKRANEKIAAFEKEAEQSKREKEIREALREEGINPDDKKQCKPSFLRSLFRCESQDEIDEMIQEHVETLEDAGLIGEGVEDEGDEQSFVRRSKRAGGKERVERPTSRRAGGNNGYAKESVDVKDAEDFAGQLRNRSRFHLPQGSF